MNELMKIENIEKSFGRKKVLDGVSLSINSSEILGYLGPNGSGKTTTIRIMLNAIDKSGGSIFLQEQEILDSDVLFRKNIGYMPENGTPFEFLTAFEYLDFTCGVYNISPLKKKEKINEMLKIFGLIDEKKKIIKNYSKGMKQKILFISAIIHNPKILILDEPFTGIDPSTAMLMKKLIIEMKNNGAGILFSSHVLEIVEKIADKVILIKNGKIVGQGNMDNLLKSGGLEGFFTQLNEDKDLDENTKKLLDIIKS